MWEGGQVVGGVEWGFRVWNQEFKKVAAKDHRDSKLTLSMCSVNRSNEVIFCTKNRVPLFSTLNHSQFAENVLT